MSDISLCDGAKKVPGKKEQICPLRDSCRRYHDVPAKVGQSWIAAPFIGKQCDHYWRWKK